MRSYIKKATITMLIIYTLVMSVLFSFYIYYSTDFSDKQAKTYANNTHQMFQESFSLDLMNHYTQFINYLDMYQDVDTLNDHLDEMTIGSHVFIGFYEIHDDGIIINNQLINFNSKDFNQTYNLDISFYRFNDVLEGDLDDTLY
ncbi:MAG TPA: hypothetical protein GX698_03035, partial [Acholeplasmataceae bacterium]|nr:hypothetical protein [Acholeplasmataceae bacterium]